MYCVVCQLISVLQNNPNELFRAIKDATKISDYLIEKGEFVISEDLTESKSSESDVTVIDPEKFNDMLQGAKKGVYESFDDFRRGISTRGITNDRFEISSSGIFSIDELLF